MVVQGDFTVELVMAENKLPFKEHVKDGKVYVEVEPDAEYFIKLQKTGASIAKDVLCKYKVDDHMLGYQTTFSKGRISKEPRYEGLWSRMDGVESVKALKFEKPRVNQNNEGNAPVSRLLMGKVTVEIYEAVFHGYEAHTHARNFSTSIVAASVDLSQGNLAKKKGLRTGAGSTTIQSASAGGTGPKATYTKGVLIDTITLNYCAALGLIEVGVLPKPDLWTHHRMKNKRVSQPGEKPLPQVKKIRDKTNNDNEVDMFDLCESDDDE